MCQEYSQDHALALTLMAQHEPDSLRTQDQVRLLEAVSELVVVSGGPDASLGGLQGGPG